MKSQESEREGDGVTKGCKAGKWVVEGVVDVCAFDSRWWACADKRNGR